MRVKQPVQNKHRKQKGIPHSHPHAAAAPATFRRFRALPSPTVLFFSSAVSAPLPRARDRVRLRERTTISTESILATDDRGLRPRGLGDSVNSDSDPVAATTAALFLVMALAGGEAAVLRGLAIERRLREAGADEGVAALGLPRLLPCASLSCARGVCMRTRARPRAGVNGVAAASALGFARALPLPLPLIAPFWSPPSASTPRAISAIPVSSVPSESPSPSQSSAA
jgi:hypothetical protein